MPEIGTQKWYDNQWVDCEDLDTLYDIQTDSFAEGGFGEIYIGIQRKTGVTYVFKRLADYSVSMNEIESMELVSKLNHPNIVQYYGSYKHKGFIYIVLEYIQGYDLAYHVDDSMHDELMPKPKGEDMKLLLCTCLDVLQSLYKDKLIHYDVNPINIMYDTINKRYVFIDFAVARTKNFSSHLGIRMYFPLELRYRNPDPEDYEMLHKKDIFCLGLTLYELACDSGFLLYGHYIDLDSLRIRSSAYKGAEYNTAMEKLIKMCLRIDHEKRPNINEILEDEDVRKLLV